METTVSPSTADREQERDRSLSDRIPRLPVSRLPPVLRTRGAAVAGLLAAAWILPLLAHLLHADLLILAAAGLGTASLLRVGSTLLDRLMITAGLLSGVLIVLGLLFSVWPWGLAPVPVGGTLLSLLVAVGAATGRRPRLPRRVLASDLIVLAAPVLSYRVESGPTAGKSFVKALAYTSSREDSFNHFALFDAARHVGGYPFLHGGASARFVMQGNQYTYPAGSHYLWALFDVFRRSTTTPDASVLAFTRYHQYEMLAMALACMAVVWSARWIAGPAMAGWRRVLICGTVGAMAVYGELSTLDWQGFDAEVLALGLLAVATAILVRPPRDVREQILLIGALMAGISFVYSLFAIFMGVGVLAAIAFYWRRLLRHWILVVVVAVVVLPISYIPFYEAKAHSGISTGPLFLQGGAYWAFSRAASVGFALIALSGLATRAGRRSPAWWVLTAFVAAACAIAVGSEWYGHSRIGQPGYYSSKMVEAAWVVSLCGFGAIGLFLKPAPRTERPRLGTRRLLDLPPAAAALAVALIFTRAVPLVPLDWQWGQPVPSGLTAGAVWQKGLIPSEWAKPTIAYAKALPLGDGVPTATIFSDNGHDNRHLTMFLAVLNGDLGLVDVEGLGGRGIDGLASVKLDPEDQLSDRTGVYLDRLEQWIREQPPGLRMAVSNRLVADALKAFAAQHPELRLAVVVVPRFTG
ncbi:hypothetical protein GCM10009839_04660 [Catenulispora yoronensis]|uniref:Glycosyltransferase RgtA/B/C/D-like domain-containing protein n=1 Tax=Catenulispora yoronensis TaxID=450799 RepID=A0ABP5F067_9ACTN